MCDDAIINESDAGEDYGGGNDDDDGDNEIIIIYDT